MSDVSDCTAVSPQCPVEATTYGYVPNFGGNIFFAVIFGICGVYHVAIGIKSRAWTFMIALAAGSLMEMIGYIGRIQMHENVWDSGAFQQQITCLILAPSFVAAGIYWSLKHIVLYISPEKSRLPPRFYPWIFIGCDIGSIIIQAAGGGIAGAAKKDNVSLLNAGNNVMIAGIAFQVVTMSICGLLAADFVYRVLKDGRQPLGHPQRLEDEAEHELVVEDNKPYGSISQKFYLFCAAETFAYVTVLIRCIYRLPEMAGGWGNPLMQNEKEFLILDGMMVALAVLALTILHPYFLCPYMMK